MLKYRLISATVIIAGLLGLLHLDYHRPLGAPGVWLLPLGLLITVMMVREMLDLWQGRPDRPLAWPVYAGAVAVVLAAGVPLLWPLTGHVGQPGGQLTAVSWPLIGFVLAMGLCFTTEMARYRTPGRSTGSMALSLLAVAYAGLLMSFLVALRLVHDHQWGMAALVSLVLIVKVSDTGAYFTGRSIGRHKLAPLLSPGKTVEGVIGGLAAGCLAAWACHSLVVPALVDVPANSGPLPHWLLFGFIVSLAGLLGDLAESLLKRDASRKDSSSWVPGLGGVLDILDSLLFAVVPALLCWTCGLIGPTAP